MRCAVVAGALGPLSVPYFVARGQDGWGALVSSAPIVGGFVRQAYDGDGSAYAFGGSTQPGDDEW